MGIWISAVIQIPVLFILGAAAIMLLASAMTLRNRASVIFLSIAFFFIGGMLLEISRICPPDHIKNFVTDEPKDICAEGLILDEPSSEKTFYGDTRVSFVLAAERLQQNGVKYPAEGKIRVSVTGSTPAPVAYGDRVLVKGKLSRPGGPGNPGGFDYAAYLARKGILAVLRADAENTVILERRAGNPIIRYLYGLRRGIRGMISSNFPKDDADFLSAILLGVREDMSRELNDTFMRTGTIHLIAISGLNVGLIAFLALLILRASRVPGKAALAAAICFLIFYAVFVGGSASVVRATIMSVALLLGLLIGREASLWNSLGLAAIIILSVDPAAIYDIGFQLSFACVASLLYLTPRLEALFRYDRKAALKSVSVWRRVCIEGFFVSLAACIGVLPFTLYHFNIITPVALLANLLDVPLSFLITASSAPFLIFGAFLPAAGKVFAASTLFFTEALFAANSIFSKS